MGDDDTLDLTGQTLGKKFLVRRSLGAGGMGAVYEVEHVLTKRVGALKLLHASVATSSRIVERFVREASAAGRIGNPHIVETIDAGELASGEPYIFMELLVGSSVSALIKKRGRLAIEESCEIVRQAAEGLGAAHAAGIVHRDVKPENLFLCAGEPPYVKLLDFGISKFELEGDHRLTAEGAPMGTPYYMSPEQVAGKGDVGPSSDIYSLGVVLYECLTGQVPYDASTLPALSIKIFEGNYAPASSVLGSSQLALDDVIARAMATSPSRRYASMAELRAALARLGSSTPLSLSRTLASSSALLDVTADAAPHSSAPAARATTEAPSRNEPPSSAPETLASGSPRGGRKAMWALGVGAVAIASAAFLAPWREPTGKASASSPGASSTSGVFTALSAEPPPTAATAPVAAPSASAASSAPTSSPHRARSVSTATARTAAPSSKAARDGLTEKNPFAE